MSFAKAKRFNYKDPDLTVSPADYYISTPMEKYCTISKCARFPTKDRESSSACKHCKRYSNGSSSSTNNGTSPKPSSTPNFRMTFDNTNSTDLEKIKNRIFEMNQQDIRRFSVSKPPRKSMVPTVKDLVNKYEPKNDPRNDTRSLPNCSSRRLSNIPRLQQKCQNFSTNEEFVDDDYHSYTSSDDIDLLSSIDYSRIEESIITLEGGKTLEDINIEKNKIKKRMEELHKNFKELHKKVDSKFIQKEGSDDKKHIIFTNIENLQRKFEKIQQYIVNQTNENFTNLADQLYTENMDSAEDLKIICRNTARDLYKNITKYAEKKDAIDFDCSYNSEDTIEQDTTLGRGEKECCDYQNISQCLPDQIEATQRKLKDLEIEKLDITLKMGGTQEKLEPQTSMVDIEELKDEDEDGKCR